VVYLMVQVLFFGVQEFDFVFNSQVGYFVLRVFGGGGGVWYFYEGVFGG
jgi:hypothetical protein